MRSIALVGLFLCAGVNAEPVDLTLKEKISHFEAAVSLVTFQICHNNDLLYFDYTTADRDAIIESYREQFGDRYSSEYLREQYKKTMSKFIEVSANDPELFADVCNQANETIQQMEHEIDSDEIVF